MKNKILMLVTVGVLSLGSYGLSASAQTASDATKPDKIEHMDKSGKADTTTAAPVDPSKSDKPGAATGASAAGDNSKTGVDPTKKGAADQTQAPKQ